MACPTCDHTMSRLGCQYNECHGSWACPRCGTLKIGHDDGRFDIIVPSLVERCREFAGKMNLGPLSNSLAVDEWRRLGIAEAIDRPADRPNTE